MKKKNNIANHVLQKNKKKKDKNLTEKSQANLKKL